MNSILQLIARSIARFSISRFIDDNYSGIGLVVLSFAGVFCIVNGQPVIGIAALAALAFSVDDED